MIDPHNIFTISGKRGYDQCPRCWAYRNVLDLEPKELSKPLIRGNEFHAGAEHAYTGEHDKLETSKQTAYMRWVKKYEDLKIANTELTLLTPLTDLYKYAGVRYTNNKIESCYYAGVTDAVGVSANKLWLLDHKSVERFYPLPDLYSKEQLGMYCVAFEIMTGSCPEGGIISRVKQLEAHNDHILNYTLKELDKQDISITKSSITRYIKDSKEVLEVRHIYIHAAGTTKINLRDKGLKVQVSRYDTEGRLVESICNLRGHLMHIQRIYYQLTQTEKIEIVKDFLRYVEQVTRPEVDIRRSPGQYCTWCPFSAASKLEREQGLEFGEGIDRTMFNVKPPNQEVTKRLEQNVLGATEMPQGSILAEKRDSDASDCQKEN